MLTLFTTAKAFRGHINVIQRNALKSWKLLHPDIEIILFGDDEGSAEVCREFGFRHEPYLARTEFGAMRLDDMFSKAHDAAKYDILCYVNCDIILMPDFYRAIRRTTSASKEFLMVGRCWDVDIAEPIDFSSPTWQKWVQSLASKANRRRNEWSLDYFAYSRGTYAKDLPAFGIGRLWWDNWLIGKALASGKAVVDASSSVVAIHQNHDYSHHPQGRQGLWAGEEQQRNMELAGGPSRLRTMEDATFLLEPEGLKRNWNRYLVALQRSKRGKFFLSRIFYPTWFFLLGVTRPLRNILGLRSKGVQLRKG